MRSSIGECNCKALDALAGEFRARQGKQCAAYYWGMQLQSARRIGRRVQRLRQGRQCAAYYWGMQLQIARRIGRGFRGRGQESNARHIIGECNCRVLDALAGEFRGRVKRK